MFWIDKMKVEGFLLCLQENTALSEWPLLLYTDLRVGGTWKWGKRYFKIRLTSAPPNIDSLLWFCNDETCIYHFRDFTGFAEYILLEIQFVAIW